MKCAMTFMDMIINCLRVMSLVNISKWTNNIITDDLKDFVKIKKTQTEEIKLDNCKKCNAM